MLLLLQFELLLFFGLLFFNKEIIKKSLFFLFVIHYFVFCTLFSFIYIYLVSGKFSLTFFFFKKEHLTFFAKYKSFDLIRRECEQANYSYLFDFCCSNTFFSNFFSFLSIINFFSLSFSLSTLAF